MTQALYRKWRPQSWEAVIGQEHVVQTLRNALAGERTAHAYLFAGPRGTGKTTTARLLAKAVNCLEPDPARRPCGQCIHCQAVNAGHFLDLIEIDAASNTSVEDVRDLRDKINFSPNQGRYKVYIIDEVHMLSTAAFNALLKTLEEPPSHAIFILATTEVHKIPATVLSRCQRHEFRRIPVNDIMALLQELAAGEGIEVEPEALHVVARQSTGSMRDAISLLDQLASTGQRITLKMAQDVLGTAASQAVLELVEALQAQDAGRGLDVIHHTLDAGGDPRQFARQVVDYLRDLLLMRMGSGSQVEAPGEQRERMGRHSQAFSTPDLLRVIKTFNHAAAEARGGWQPSLPLEMAFVEALEGPQPELAGIEIASGASTTRAAAPPTPPLSQKPQAALAPEPAAQPSPPTSEASPEQRQVAQVLGENWPRILAVVRKDSPNTLGLLNSAKDRFLRGNDLILSFASDVLKAKMEKEENLAAVQGAIQTVLGREMRVVCEVNIAKRNAVPPNVDHDGMVAAALRDLGGEIVDIQ